MKRHLPLATLFFILFAMLVVTIWKASHLDFTTMVWFKLALLPLATWRLYRLVALDTGPWCLFRRFRVKIGVKYGRNPDDSVNYNEWHTDDGSFAEGLCCSKCAPIWWAEVLMFLLLFGPDKVYLFVAMPFNLSTFVLVFENVFYAPRVKQ